MNLKNYSLFCLCWTLLTVFWGAWVRLSLSGDACGKSWPLCSSGFLPESTKQAIEWWHRLSSGLALLFVLFLCFWVFYKRIRNPALRLFSFLSAVFILLEAFIGALLVLKAWVGLNPESLRFLALALHSVNSVFLMGSLTLSYKACLWLKPQNSLKKQIRFDKLFVVFAVFFVLLALTGNIASLAGQLFPAQSLQEALLLDLQPSSPISLKIRILHPLLALVFLLVLFRLVWDKKKLWRACLAVFLMVLVGFATLLSLSPLFMKLIHLFCAYALGIFLLNESVKEA